MATKPRPGVSRQRTTADEGLARLEKQLRTVSGITDFVLLQWIRRYGEAARVIMRRHGRNPEDFEKSGHGLNKDQ